MKNKSYVLTKKTSDNITLYLMIKEIKGKYIAMYTGNIQRSSIFYSEEEAHKAYLELKIAEELDIIAI